MLDSHFIFLSLAACVAAAIIAFAATPLVQRFARKIGAIDVPKDDRRMHKVPTPRVGGLAIFAGFLVSVLIFSHLDMDKRAMLLGALVIVVLGILDDTLTLKAPIKLFGQIAAALIPVFLGDMVIQSFSNPFGAGYIHLHGWGIPITIIWIVGLTNAVNFIDGLDGLSCGVSCIASVTMFTIAVLLGEADIAIVMAALVGACVGFLPFNMNPAKIFMGDTGAMFLGYILALVSIQGLFKVYAVVSFAVPFIMMGLPIFDTVLAVVRRVSKGQSPMQADRGHIHHKLIDMGFDQKQSVAILYVLSVILGLCAVLLTTSGEARIVIVVAAVLISFFISMSTRLFGLKHKGEPRSDDTPGEGEDHDDP
jgi:UDP-GlcNAc:undecaprenyl-phosphate GlcNAc-1-phosphate transferase